MMVNKLFRCLKKVNMLDSKTMEGKFMVYADFENVLVPEDDGKQNLDLEYYRSKYQKHVA